jgi:nitroreductase
MSSRTTEFPVDADFIQRWSPRSFTGKAMSRAELMSLFEAARWAPSTSNTQPWRFVYGLAGSADFDTICQTLAPTNRAWAHRASALIAVISATVAVAPGIFVEAAHGMGAPPHFVGLQGQAHPGGAGVEGMHGQGVGVEKDALRKALGVPDTFALHCVVAVGEQGDKAVLGEALQAREAPNARQPLSAMVCEGRFGFER